MHLVMPYSVDIPRKPGFSEGKGGSESEEERRWGRNLEKWGKGKLW